MTIEFKLGIHPAAPRLQDQSHEKQPSLLSGSQETSNANSIKDRFAVDDTIKEGDFREDKDIATQILQQEDVSRAISNLNDYVQNSQRQLHFNVDEVTGNTVIQVVDSETEEVVRQIPSEEIMAIARDHIRREDQSDGGSSGDNKGKLFHIQI